MIRAWWRRTGQVPSDPIAFQKDLAAAWGVDPKHYPIDALRSDFRATFADLRARRVLYKILEWGHVYQPSHVAGDPHGTAFRDGERNLALRILAATNAEPKNGAADRAQTTNGDDS